MLHYMKIRVIRQHHPPEQRMCGKGAVFYLIHTIIHALIINHERYLYNRISLVGSTYGYQSSTPRFILQITYRKMSNHIV